MELLLDPPSSSTSSPTNPSSPTPSIDVSENDEDDPDGALPYAVAVLSRRKRPRSVIEILD